MNHGCRRSFSTANCLRKIVPSGLKGGTSSNNWMSRQLNDQYVKMAKVKNYRARSAFKLIEIDDKYHFLRPGMVVIDCGATPGSWTQVTVQRINSDAKASKQPIGKIIALDLDYMEPVPGATVLCNADVTKQETLNQVLELLDGQKTNVVLSDMAPVASGIKTMDHENSTQLVYAAMRMALLTLKIGGTLVAKSLEGGSGKQIESDLLRYFSNVRFVKPNASRTDSSEIFFLAREFIGIRRPNSTK